jgi:cobalt-zinc-cadmium efflux system membrane fusion protein
VFSPYAGRVTKLLVRPGDSVTQGPAAVRDRGRRHRAGAERFHRGDDALNKAKSALDLAQIQDKRAKDLFEGKAVPLKDYQQTQAT